MGTDDRSGGPPTNVVDVADPEALLDRGVDATLVIDPGGVLLAASPSFATAFGHDVDDLVGRAVVDLIHPEDQGAALASLSNTVAAGGRRVPLRCRARDGAGRWRAVELVANALEDPASVVVLSVRDRSGEHDVEQRLAERSELYRQIVELVADGVLVLDEHHRTSFVSAPMAEMLGWSIEEMLGRPVTDFLDDHATELARQALRRRPTHAVDHQTFRFRHRDGHAVWVRINGRPLAGYDPYRGAIAVVADISDQIAESNRRERDHAHLRGVLDALPDLVFELDRSGTYLDASAARSEDLIAPVDELLGRTVAEMLPAAVAPDVESAIVRTLDQGCPQELEFELDLRGRARSFHARMAPSGAATVVAVVRDVTELRAAEDVRVNWAIERQRREDAERRASLERRLQTTDRLDALGRLSGGVAHDVNNLLGVIGNYSAVIRRASSDRVLLGDLDGIDDAVRHGSELTRRLLRFGQLPGSEPEAVDVAAVVAGVGAVVRRTGPSDVSVEITPVEVDCTVLVDRAQLEQAVVNLVINAVDASPPGGTVVLRVHHVGHDRDRAGEGEVHVTVLDRGPGIPEDLRDRVVEPFFTTKGPGEGTGLGLSIAHGVVHEAGGRLEIEDRAGGGAQVTLALPSAGPGADDQGSPLSNDDGLDVRYPAVVVVDDDTAGLASVTRLLRAHGLRVHPAASADEAESLLDGDATLSCVLSDVMMPGRSGLDLDRHLRTTRPDVRVVLMTGVAHGDSVEVPADRTVLAKPLAIDELLDALAPVDEANQLAVAT